MFNIGGIFRGIGDAAESAVVQGRRNKHEKEQMNLRAELADKAASKARTQLLTDKLNQEKLDRKNRFTELQMMGFDDPIALAASRTKGAYDAAVADLQHMRALTEKDSLDRNINDAYSVGFGKDVKAPDFVKGTKPTINVQSVLEQMDKATDMDQLANIELGAVVKRNEGFFKPVKTNEDQIEELKSKLLAESNVLADMNKLENQDAYLKQEKLIEETTFKLKTRLDVQKKHNALLNSLSDAPEFEYDQLRSLMADVETNRKAEWDKLGRILRDGTGLPEGVQISLKDYKDNYEWRDGALKAKGAAKNIEQMEQLLNYITTQAVDRVASAMEKTELSGKVDSFKDIYSTYLGTTDVSTLYTGNPFVANVDGDIPNQRFYDFILKNKGKYIKFSEPGYKGRRMFLDDAKVNDYINRYRQYYNLLTTSDRTGSGPF